MRGGPRYVQLPDHFVDSLRVLFDILDIDKSGYIAYDDICSRWRQLPTEHLPNNFLDCVKRITPPNGMLTFERFLAGVRLSLLEKRNDYPSKIHRVQSEGKLNNDQTLSAQNSYDKKRNNPSMGLNGFIIDRKPQIYQSQPMLMVNSPSPVLGNGYANGQYHSPMRKEEEEQYSVVMRPKKVDQHHHRNGVQSSIQQVVVPPAPPLPINSNKNLENNNNRGLQETNARFRPISSNSVTSSASSMAEIKWRNSRMSSSPSTTLFENGSNRNTYCEAVLPQVAKHEKLLNEEYDLLKKGIETTQKLHEWYEQRLTSLEKRRQMLEKGMVALDSAVHEQKLNFVRAQITELNRRMLALVSTSERGFPTHENMQIRNPIAPQQPTVLNGSTGSRSTSDGSLTPPAGVSPSNTAQWLHKQNQRLTEELEVKSRLIEQLQREKRLQELRNGHLASNGGGGGIPAPATRKIYAHPPQRPAALVRPAPHQNEHQHLIHGIPQPLVKVHDTLL